MSTFTHNSFAVVYFPNTYQCGYIDSDGFQYGKKMAAIDLKKNRSTTPIEILKSIQSTLNAFYAGDRLKREKQLANDNTKCTNAMGKNELDIANKIYDGVECWDRNRYRETIYDRIICGLRIHYT